MNRREFFAKLLVAQSAFLILPSAKLYRRTWKQLLCPRKIWTPNQYVNVFDDFRLATEDLSNIISRSATSSVWKNLIGTGCDPHWSIMAIGNIEPALGDSAWEPISLC